MRTLNDLGTVGTGTVSGSNTGGLTDSSKYYISPEGVSRRAESLALGELRTVLGSVVSDLSCPMIQSSGLDTGSK